MLYEEKLEKPIEALKMYAQVRNTFVKNKDAGLIAAIPAEAAFRSGELSYVKIIATELKGNSRAKEKIIKGMAKHLEVAIGHYSFAIEQAEQKWTLRSTMRMGDLFMAFASVTGKEVVSSKNEIARFGALINIKKGLPNFYGKGRNLYQKNLDIAKEQSIKSPWVDTSSIKYLNTYFLEGMVYEDIGNLLLNSPIPPGLTQDELEEYKAALEDKQMEFMSVAEGKYGNGLKAAQFYGLDNEESNKIKERLRELNPEAAELNLEILSEEEMKVVYVDDTYKSNKDKINTIYSNGSYSDDKKINKLKKLKEAADAEIKKLTEELKSLAGEVQ